MIAMGLVLGNSEKVIIRIAVNGTLKNIPAIPHMLPHIASDNITTSGLKFNELAINLGSRILPMEN